MAYAAVVTLGQDLQEILESTPVLSDELQLIQEKLRLFLKFLENSSWFKRINAVENKDLVSEIRDLAYQLQDILDNNRDHDGCEPPRYLDQMEQMLIHRFPSLENRISRLQKEIVQDQTVSVPQIHVSYRYGSPEGKKLIGLENELDQLRKRLIGQVKDRETIAIVGIGGSGKTTLAKTLYQDGAVNSHFDVAVWVTVSQEYDKREIMLRMLDSMGILTPEMQEESNIRLNEELYRYLRKKRHLIVMDDLWSKDAFDDVKNMLPDDRQNNSRIVITTRLQEVAKYAVWRKGCFHQMRFLTVDESWELLCTRAFDAASCPDFLMEIGKKIAVSCKGLPLAIEVISGYLRSKPMEKPVWEEVATQTTKDLGESGDFMRQMILLSYDELPQFLKPCFLHLGMFAEDEKIRVSDLAKTWEAEGFLPTVSSLSPEEVTIGCLVQLGSRNLVIIDSKCGRMVSCSIHDVLRDLCLEIAQEEKFAAPAHTHSYVPQPRRLAIHGDISSLRSMIAPENLSHLRSFRCKKELNEDDPSSYLNCCQLLRVVELPTFNFFGHRIDMLKLSHLRYLSLSVKKWSIPEHFAEYFCNLGSLIMRKATVKGTQVLWRMPNLRHLCFGSSDMKCPEDKELKLPNLETLMYIRASNCSPALFSRTPNLVRLGVKMEEVDYRSFDHQWRAFSIDNLSNFPKLEVFKFKRYDILTSGVPDSFTLPNSLIRLTLSDTRLPWESMSVVGKLPYLEELKLFRDACIGGTWVTNEGEFQQLKLLTINGSNLRRWESSDDHLPQLVHLVLWNCVLLEELPSCLEEIPTLKIIQLDSASPSAVRRAQELAERFRDSGIHIAVDGGRAALPLERQVSSFMTTLEDLKIRYGMAFSSCFLLLASPAAIVVHVTEYLVRSLMVAMEDLRIKIALGFIWGMLLFPIFGFAVDLMVNIPERLVRWGHPALSTSASFQVILTVLKAVLWLNLAVILYIRLNIRPCVD